MENVWYIKPQGSTLERAIINALNFISGMVYDKIVNPNNDKLDINVQDTETLKIQVNEDNDTILDLQYQNNLLQDQVEEDNDAILDIDYRVSKLEEN